MQQAIKEAMQTFADFAAFQLVRDGEHYVVTIADIDPDADGDVAAEFSNFALHNTMMRKKKRI
jgi:predicted RNA-binding protein with TRAM domain